MYAIYDRSKIILWIMGTAFAIEYIVVLVATLDIFRNTRMNLTPGCVVVDIPSLLTAAW